MKIRWLEDAIPDLQEIREYISRENPNAANRVSKKILQNVKYLSDHPEMGRPGRIVHTRELIIPDLTYIIPYRVHNDTIEIIRVFHCAREWPENF